MGSKSKQRRTRKQRRQTRAVLRFGPAATPTHKSRSGRTGKVRSSQLKGRRSNARPAEGGEG